MKILHAPVVVAGQSIILTKALRRLGHQADSLNYYNDPFGYKSTYNLVSSFKNPTSWLANHIEAIFRIAPNYDIYHFHFAKSLAPLLFDLPVYKIKGKKIVFELHGSDIRPPFMFKDYFGIWKASGLYFKQLLTRLVSNLAIDAVVVTTPDLLEYIGKAEYIPVAIDLQEKIYQETPARKSEEFVIVHSTTKSKVKGTPFIVKSIKDLSGRRKVHLRLIENTKRDEALKVYKKSSLAIDQLRIGWYGMFSVELMALGKPVICYIREDLKKFAPDLPIVNSSKNSLVEDVGKLIKDSNLRKKLGEEGRLYVAKNHDSIKIAKRFVRLYKSL